MSSIRFTIPLIPACSALALAVLSLSCIETTFTINEKYCGEHDGDAYCQRVSPSTPYCVRARNPCYEQLGVELGGFGCSEQMPMGECRQQCGLEFEDACLPVDASSTDDPPGSSSDNSSQPTDGSTEDSPPPECNGPADCTEESRPFCLEFACAPCSAFSDNPCPSKFNLRTVCYQDLCVPCSPEQPGTCPANSPICDTQALECVSCSAHQQCQDLGSPACDFVTGACLPQDSVVEVDVGVDGSIASAIAGVAPSATAVFLMSASSSTGNHEATIDGGKTIYLMPTIGRDRVSVNGISRSSDDTEPSMPVLTVADGSSAYLHSINISGSSDFGILVQQNSSLVADGLSVRGNTGGGIRIEENANAMLVNSIVASNGAASTETTAIANAGNLNANFLSVVANLGREGAPQSLSCSENASAAIRNSIILGLRAESALCDGAVLSHSATDSSLGGEGVVQLDGLDFDWFTDVDDGELSESGRAVFEDVGLWQNGDPLVDYEGTERPAIEGPTLPGAVL